MKKIILCVAIFFIKIFTIWGSQDLCEQRITVKYTPYKGVKIYSITGGKNDKRGVIDLGHFNGKNRVERLNIGTIEVLIEMEENGKGSTENDIEVINLKSLETFSWQYKYDTLAFIGIDNSVIANIELENFQIINQKNNLDNNFLNFICLGDHEEHAKYLKYKFDLILTLSNLEEGSMYGFSPRKDSGNNVYVNLKDIILDQLKGSGLTK